MSQCGYFLPIKNNDLMSRAAKISTELNFYKNSYESVSHRGKKPFFSIGDDETTVKLFLEALAQSHQDDAKAYVSKNFTDNFDFNELTDFFNRMENYKYLIKVEFEQKPKNCKTNSILIMSKDSHMNSIIHLHLIKEPDKFSNWKIYGIEKE